MIQIAPSLLAADFSALGREVEKVREGDMLHIDVMDGRFVPNISVGPAVTSALRSKSPLHFNVHLMLEDPLPYIAAFRKAGADSVAFHIESAGDPARTIQAIRESGALPCMALNPETPPQALEPYGDGLYLITVMTVRPGFGGQKLLPECLEKVRWLKARFPGVLIQVDGGVNLENAGRCAAAGADVLVAGTAVFGSPDPRRAIESLRRA